MWENTKMLLSILTVQYMLIQTSSESMLNSGLKSANNSEFCQTYASIFRLTTLIKVHIIHNDHQKSEKSLTGIYLDQIFKCLGERSITFAQKISHYKSSRNFLQGKYEEFELIENEIAQQRTYHEIQMVYGISTRIDIGEVIIFENPSDLLSYFNKHGRECFRCVHLLLYSGRYINEDKIYRLIKQIWNIHNILNVIIHCFRSEAKNYVYSYNPFQLRYVNLCK